MCAYTHEHVSKSKLINLASKNEQIKAQLFVVIWNYIDVEELEAKPSRWKKDNKKKGDERKNQLSKLRVEIWAKATFECRNGEHWFHCCEAAERIFQVKISPMFGGHSCC